MQSYNAKLRFGKQLRATAAAGLLLVSQGAFADLSNKWRLEFSGGADSTGAIVVRVTPQGGSPIDTTVNVPMDTAENDIAAAVTQSLQTELPPESFLVERDDGEDVLIKAMDGAADFSVAVTSNTVKGVSINPDKE